MEKNWQKYDVPSLETISQYEYGVWMFPDNVKEFKN